MDGVEVFANVAADRDADQALFESGAQAREEFGF